MKHGSDSIEIWKIKYQNIKFKLLFLKRGSELGEGWIQGLKTELEPVQRILGEGWKEVAEKYIDKLEDEI